MATRPAVRLPIKTAVQYDPRRRGVRLALGYVRRPRSLHEKDVYDIYGFLVGYSGGGCYDDEFFHVEERRGTFTTYVSSWGVCWAADRIGLSGLEGKRLDPEIDSLLESIQAALFRRWLKWTDDGLPELQSSAKTRLNCWRRRAFWLSPGFDYDLLRFLSEGWGLSVDFGDRAEEFRQHHQQHLAKYRALQRAIETLVIRYPEVIEHGLRLIRRERIGRRAVLIFLDRSEAQVIVEPKWEPPTITELKNLASYRNSLSPQAKGRTRLILVGTSITPEVRHSLKDYGIEWRCRRPEQLISFLRKRSDDKLAAAFERSQLKR